MVVTFQNNHAETDYLSKLIHFIYFMLAFL